MAYLDRLRSVAQREPRPRIRLVIRAIRDHHHFRTRHDNHRNLNDNHFHDDDLDNVHQYDDNDHDNRARNTAENNSSRGDHDELPGDHHHLDNARLPRRDKHHPRQNDANNRHQREHNLDILVHDNPPS